MPPPSSSSRSRRRRSRRSRGVGVTKKKSHARSHSRRRRRGASRLRAGSRSRSRRSRGSGHAKLAAAAAAGAAALGAAYLWKNRKHDNETPLPPLPPNEPLFTPLLPLPQNQEEADDLIQRFDAMLDEQYKQIRQAENLPCVKELYMRVLRKMDEKGMFEVSLKEEFQKMPPIQQSVALTHEVNAVFINVMHDDELKTLVEDDEQLRSAFEAYKNPAAAAAAAAIEGGMVPLRSQLSEAEAEAEAAEALKASITEATHYEEQRKLLLKFCGVCEEKEKNELIPNHIKLVHDAIERTFFQECE